MLVDNAPSEAVVQWAEDHIPAIKCPKDRPWFMSDPPPHDTAFWNFPCRCTEDMDMPQQVVEVKRYVCEDGKGSVYLGQCQRCETVIWAYREI